MLFQKKFERLIEMKLERWISPKTCVTVEGNEHMALVKAIVSAQEVFGESHCGKCGKDNLQFAIRKATDAKGKEEYEYPELHCLDCRAKLTYGQAKDKTLFPVRFKRTGKEYDLDENGKYIPKGKNGWVKWNFDKQVEE